MTRRLAAVVAAICVGAVAPGAVMARVVPASAGFTRSAVVLSTGKAVVRLTQIGMFEQPVGVVTRPDDPLMYVIEKTGRLKTLAPDGARQTVLDLSKNVSTQNERGLLSVAFPPGDRSRIYVTYTDSVGALMVTEFAYTDARVDPTTERVLLRIPHPNDDHNGGSLAFDADGLLYIGVGDGGGVGTRGGVGDRDNNAQNLNVLLGKILRIDPRPLGDGAYQIPPSNPFVKSSSLKLSDGKRRPEIFAYGLRNPWRIRIDDGYLWIAEVGQSSWEEINRIPITRVGANFGWRLREGRHAYRGGGKPTGLFEPIFEYPHSDGRCAVIGGTVATSSSGTELVGTYVFGDLCTGRFMQLRQTASAGWTMTDLGTRVAYLTSISSGPGGSLIATSLNGGVYRFEPTA